ncbi:MAG: acyl carrier protein [Candidatus Eremiobacteraeota bacterium]|nr:acyl carrier protein [Candidatus Eremiobacteraeota bacterium]
MARPSAEVGELITEILTHECGVKTAITDESLLAEELGLDSVGMLALALGLENHYQMKLGEDAQNPPRSVGELRRLVESRLEQREVS